MIEPSVGPEKIVIVGGGLGGGLAALFAARAGYKVTLVEQQDKIFNGACLLASQLHLGAEYPLDPQTAEDCLRGAAIWKLMMPRHIYTNYPMRFMVTAATEKRANDLRKQNRRAAKRGEPERPFLTVEKNRDAYEVVRQKYQALIDEIHDVTHWKREDIQARLFGSPEKGQGKFYHEIDPEREPNEFRYYPQHGRYRMAGGIKTQQIGFKIANYLSQLEFELSRHPNIEVVTNHEVTAIKEHGERGYEVVCANGKTFHGDQVIRAAWESGMMLDTPHRGADHSKTVTVYRRAMAVVDISAIPSVDMAGTFALEGEDGGMFCQWTDKSAVLYHPGTAYLGEKILTAKDSHVPKEWRQPLARGQEQAMLKTYREKLLRIYPFLQKADFKNGKIVVRYTLNFQDQLHQRRHEATEEIKPGYHTLDPTKLTLAPQAAIEAMEAVRARSAQKAGHGYIRRTALQAALEPEEKSIYHLQDIGAHGPSIDFTKTRGLPINMISEIAHDERVYNEIVRSPKPPEPTTGGLTTSATTVENRSFGQGFGNHKVTLYTETGPKTGRLFERDEDYETIQRWVDDPTRKAITNLLPPERLSRAVHNQLLHADMLDLLEMVPDLLTDLPYSDKAHLFSKENLDRIPAETWSAIRASGRKVPETGFNPYALYNYFSASGEVDRQQVQEVAAAVLPMLFAALPQQEKNALTHEIAVLLHKQGKDLAFFAPLADRSLNNVIVHHTDAAPLHAARLFNNGRAIQVDPSRIDLQNGPLYLRFQGKNFYPVQFHFHRNKNLDISNRPINQVKDSTGKQDGALEFRLYKDRRHELASRNSDPNDEVVGELHAIFMHQDSPQEGKPAHRTALALCAHVHKGARNWKLDDYFQPLEGMNRPLAEGEGITRPTMPFAPLEAFESGAYDGRKNVFAATGLPEAPFASLHLGGVNIDPAGKALLNDGSSDIFYRGVHVVHLPKPITVGVAQLRALQNAQPALSPFVDKVSVRPIARGHTLP